MTDRGSGAARFARFAFPPNVLGHCGAPGHDELWAYASGQAPVDGGLDALAATFDGAWPYLTLLAGVAGHDDPLADDVVRAYWLGGPLLDRVPLGTWGWHVRDRFSARVGREGQRALEGASAGGRPTHAFHVLCVYPWIGMLRSGLVDEPMTVLDRCRIRWGRVEQVVAGRALVHARPLTWADGRLSLGPPEVEEAVIGADGHGLVDDLAPGDLVALHWGWVCERIGPDDVRRLIAETVHHLAIANTPRVGALV